MAQLPCPPEHWPEFSRLLDDALSLPVGDRDAWLERIAPDLAHLRPWLSRVLRADAQARTGDLQFPRLASTPESEAEFQAGQQIGDYRLVARLGSGGMGEVWSAHRIDGGLSRTVALKLPHPWLFSGRMRQRLDRERDILASLTHPNIAQLYDAGVFTGGQPFLALELVQGQAIDAYCRAARLDVVARIGLFKQVLEAVRHAHGRLIVHRDLKPSNILVDTEGHAKLLDFGIAKLLDDQGAASASEVTRLAGRALTPEYAAPEQLEGDEVSVATDVFSLGVVLFELLTGRRPFDKQRPPEMPLASTRVDPDHAMATGCRDARELRRQLEGDLDAIAARCLSTVPAQRYSSVDQLADDLDRHLHLEPIRARHVGRVERSLRFVRRNRLAVAMTAALVTTALIGAAGVAWQGYAAAKARDEANLRREKADGLIDFMLGDLRERLEPVGRLDVLDAVSGKVRAYVAEGDVARLDDTALMQRARALLEVSDIQFARYQPEDSLASARQAEIAARETVRRHPDDAAGLTLLATILQDIARLMVEGGDAEQAKWLVGEVRVAVQQARAVGGPSEELDWVEAGLALVMGTVHAFRHEDAEAVSQFDVCVDRLQPYVARAGYPVRKVRDYLVCKEAEANTLYRSGQIEPGLEAFRILAIEARDLLKIHGNHPGLLFPMVDIDAHSSEALRGEGRLDEARPAADEALELARQLVAFDPENNLWKNKLGNALFEREQVARRQHDWATMRGITTEEIAIYEALLRSVDDSSQTRLGAMDSHLQRGLALHFLGDDAAAVTDAEAAVALGDGKEAVDIRIFTLSARLYVLEYLGSSDAVAARTKAGIETLVAQLTAPGVTLPPWWAAALRERRMRFAYLSRDAAEGDRLWIELRDADAVHRGQNAETRARMCDWLARQGSAPRCAVVG